MSTDAERRRPAGDEAIDISSCRVLVVDDAVSTQRLIAAYLCAAGISRLEFAGDGAEGLARIESFKPDLVILDIMMPKMDGYEVCRRLRADAPTRRLPVLVQTALESPYDRTEIFRAGATDLITKPIHGPELIARVRLHLENRLLIESLQDYRRAMSWELDLARDMQEHLLPPREAMASVEAATGIGIESHFHPSAELGGDIWAVQPLGAGKVGIGIVDFSGHGLTAALNTFRLHTLMQESAPDPENPAGYLTELNGHLVDLLPSYQFATMFYAVIDRRRGTLTYAAAGAPQPIIGTPEVEILDVCGLPLGISHDADYANHRTAFPAGSFLFLYSDALTETPDLSGQCLAARSLAELVGRCRDDPAAGSPLATLISRFHARREPIFDDLTLVWLQSNA